MTGPDLVFWYLAVLSSGLAANATFLLLAYWFSRDLVAGFAGIVVGAFAIAAFCAALLHLGLSEAATFWLVLIARSAVMAGAVSSLFLVVEYVLAGGDELRMLRRLLFWWEWLRQGGKRALMVMVLAGHFLTRK